jgi:hypothetical protein
MKKPKTDSRDVRVPTELLEHIADCPASGSGEGSYISGRIQSMARELLRLRKYIDEVSPSSRIHNVEEGDMCRECGGSGYKLYGSTATWRGGIGGQAMTDGVCDYCWGSGSNSKPWPSWRKYEALEKKVDK